MFKATINTFTIDEMPLGFVRFQNKKNSSALAFLNMKGCVLKPKYEQNESLALLFDEMFPLPRRRHTPGHKCVEQMLEFLSFQPANSKTQ